MYRPQCDNYRMYGHGDIPCNLDRLAVIETLKLCELLCVTLDEIGQLVDQPGPLKACDIFAPGGFERLPGCGDCDIDVLFGCCRMTQQKTYSVRGHRMNHSPGPPPAIHKSGSDGRGRRPPSHG